MKRKRDPLMEFHTALGGGLVDEQRGIITGVSVITNGVMAIGHDIHVDDTTLLQMKFAADSRPGGKVPVKWNHKTGADEVCGYLVNFRVDGDKLKADWHLLDHHPRRDQALELASRMPDGVGLSASFFGKNEKKGPKTFARCSKLQSVDLVAAPAANPDGLFEEGQVDSDARSMSTNTNSGQSDDTEKTGFDAIMAKLTELGTAQTQISQRLTALEEGVAHSHEEGDDDGDEEEGDEGEGAEEFGSLGEAIQYLSARLDAAEDAREQELQEQAFAQIEHNFNALLELNERLATQNEFLAKAVKELSTTAGVEVKFSAGTGDGEHSFEIVPQGKAGATLTEFETRVAELQKGGKSMGEALLFAQKEDPARHQRHLHAKGGLQHA